MTTSADRQEKIFTVLLEDETAGTYRSWLCLCVGDPIVVELHDENGNPIQKTGRVAEILLARDPWN